MHSCLLISEVVRNICNEIDGRYESQNVERNTSLYAMAQTCQSFRDPALESLWEAIPDMVTIFRCFGRDTCKVLSTDSGLELTFFKYPTASDVDTMKKYASLVRYIGRSDFNRPSISLPHNVSKFLEDHISRDEVLFPQVRSIDLGDISAMEMMGLFSTEYLTSITLRGINSGYEAQSVSSVLADLSSRSPNLKSVNLNFASTFWRWLAFDEEEVRLSRQRFVAALSNWRHLSQFISTGATLEVLHAISNSSTLLQHLTFHELATPPERPEDAYQLMLSRTETPSFPMLRAASTSFPELPTANQFIDHLPANCGLEDLTMLIQHIRPTQENDWVSLLESVKKHAHSLKKFGILDACCCDDEDNVDMGAANPFSNALITMLTTNFKTLTHLNISTPVGFYVGDEDLEKLTVALPLLEHFRLLTWTSSTLASLSFFAKNCRSLLYLGLVFNARAEKIPEKHESLGQALGVELLNVHRSYSLDNPQLVTNFLLSIFPNLNYIEYDEFDPAEPWSEVRDLLDERAEEMDTED